MYVDSYVSVLVGERVFVCVCLCVYVCVDVCVFVGVFVWGCGCECMWIAM